ncbi:MAG TPA: hypothetical protein VFW19_08130 [Allosphingosinicella sp.]|nr:hypothetical protein [Allosphingosinicella sp.]
MRAGPIAAAFILSFLSLHSGAAGARPVKIVGPATVRLQVRPRIPSAIVIQNDTGRAARLLELAPAAGGGGSRTFQNVASGVSLGVSLAPAGGCAYRLRVVLADSSAAERQVDFCAGASIRLSQLLAPRILSRPGETFARPGPHSPPPRLLPSPPPSNPDLVVARSHRVEQAHLAESAAIPPSRPQAGGPNPAAAAVPAQDGTPFCEVLQRPAAKGDCDAYTQMEQRMQNGSAGLLAPKSMQEGETRTVSLAISRGDDQSENLLGRKPSQSFTTKVSGLMAAKLEGDGFTVKPLSADVQQVSAIGGQRWDWNVTALQARRHVLILSIYVVANPNDPAEARPLLLTRRYPVTVKVPMLEQSERGMDAATEWLKHLLSFENALWAVLTAGIAVALWKAIRRRIRKKRGRAG